MGSAQRVFLMKQARALLPEGERFPTLDAEELALEYLHRHSPATPGVSLSILYIPAPASPGDEETRLAYLRPSVLTGVWEIDTPGGTGIALYRQEGMFAEAASGAVTILPPGAESPVQGPSVSLPADPPLVGWQLVMGLQISRGRPTVAYLWIGILLVGVMVAMAALVARLVARQMRIARLKNDLVATVSHELKTPLASIRLLTETLLDGHYEDAEKTREYLDLISNENTRLGRLIDNFLAFSRMERGKAAFDLGPADPRQIVEDALAAVGEKMDVEVRVEEHLPRVTADRDAMVTVLVNLLDNAHKYSQDDRRVTLRVRREGGDVCFDVEDRGIGLSRRAARKVFDRFYQVDRSLSREVGGVGLGLSIVRFIVDAHGGSVDVTSELGKGSTFTVRLPGGGAHGR
jgi:signal transduction histidine kinase